MSDVCRYNACNKLYPDGHKKTTVFNFPVFNPHGLYVEKKQRLNYSRDKGITRDDSIKRGIDKIYDIAILNNFDYFVTFTLDKNKIDRYDYSLICSKLKKWLQNAVQRNNASYIIVPELHQDGAVHFHGLISGEFDLADSGLKTSKNQTIYNLNNWKLGFTTCIELDENKVATARYLCKYITKDTKMILGNLYYAGGKINREPPKEYDNVLFYEALGKTYEIGCTALKVKYYVSEVEENER